MVIDVRTKITFTRTSLNYRLTNMKRIWRFNLAILTLVTVFLVPPLLTGQSVDTNLPAIPDEMDFAPPEPASEQWVMVQEDPEFREANQLPTSEGLYGLDEAAAEWNASGTSVCPGCGGICGGNCGQGGVRLLQGVDEASCRSKDCEPQWSDAHAIPWEAFAWGEYIGPAAHRMFLLSGSRQRPDRICLSIDQGTKP